MHKSSPSSHSILLLGDSHRVLQKKHESNGNQSPILLRAEPVHNNVLASGEARMEHRTQSQAQQRPCSKSWEQIPRHQAGL